MYSAVIYFAGPKSRWAGKIDPEEKIYRCDAPMLWLARLQVMNVFGQLDDRKCGYALLHDGKCVEQYDPPGES